MYQIEEMPVLNYYSREVSERYFRNTNVLYVNHLISDSLMIARAFKNSGAEMWIVTIQYGNVP